MWFYFPLGCGFFISGILFSAVFFSGFSVVPALFLSTATSAGPDDVPAP